MNESYLSNAEKIAAAVEARLLECTNRRSGRTGTVWTLVTRARGWEQDAKGIRDELVRDLRESGVDVRGLACLLAVGEEAITSPIKGDGGTYAYGRGSHWEFYIVQKCQNRQLCLDDLLPVR